MSVKAAFVLASLVAACLHAATSIGADAASTARPVAFGTAEPVWSAGSNQSQLELSTEFMAEDAAELRIAASAAYEVRLNGIIVGSGPYDGLNGRPCIEKWLLWPNEGANRLEISARPANGGEPFLQAELSVDGRLTASTSVANGGFDAGKIALAPRPPVTFADEVLPNELRAGNRLTYAPVPPTPGPESWTFKEELAKPLPYHAREAYRLDDAYGLAGDLETVSADLSRFFASAPSPAVKTLHLRKGTVEGRESYRAEVAANGDVTLTAEDDDGLRRAAYWFEDRVAAGDLRPCVRKPWLRHRISRCYFGPIKRPPFNRDELMDDVDYYPDEYLNRLAHEGINGLWLTIEWRNLVETSFNRRDIDAPRRLAKLRRTVAKCRRYGIATWLFCIEPRAFLPTDPVILAHPAMTTGVSGWDGKLMVCPSSPESRQYIEEATRDLFTQVPGLPGILNISHGERPTTCLSAVSPITGMNSPCPHCGKLSPWQIHWQTASSIVKGMRSVSPQAEFLSWFYQPQAPMERADWTAEVAAHLPEGVTMIYNFESGAVREQLGRYRPGGDYWLSYTGPSPAFRRVADASREAKGKLGAKIQVGCSHECATVPFVPVPGLLYRKYQKMREMRCSSVMQCWYFGNCPGVMNRAAGELAFEDFADDETAFLERLARPDWGEDAERVAELWRRLSDAYANYPLSNDMQYYGPFHAGIAWPLEPLVHLRRLGRTWKPQDPPSGDTIGECLENHTVEEASLLSARMADIGCDGVLDELTAKYAGDPERLRDIGLMRTLELLFASGADIFEFYRLRAKAVCDSRERHDAAAALRSLVRMLEIVDRERANTEAMLPLAEADSRIGFHSEAEAHQFHPAKLRWRLAELNRASTELSDIVRTITAGGEYPLSERERKAPAIRVGEMTPGLDGFRFMLAFAPNGDLLLEGESPNDRFVRIRTLDACAVSWARELTLRSDGTYSAPTANVVTPKHEVREYAVTKKGSGWSFRLRLDARGWGDDPARRPAWLCIFSGDEQPVWPGIGRDFEGRLNIGIINPEMYGRIVR